MTTMIDCDVHPYVNTLAEVLGYMPRAWQERFRAQNVELSGRSVHRYPHPAGGSLRKDAVPPAGGLPGSDPDYVVSDLLDRYELAVALLIPIQASAVSAWTDAARADVFTEAFNRHMAERWPSVDPRFRLCITASPHDTEHAAAEILRWRDTPSVVAVSLPLLDTMMGNKHYYPIYAACSDPPSGAG
jgi:uncharacterized protein